jgi:hypothetical protein
VLEQGKQQENIYPELKGVFRKYRFVENTVLFASIVVACVTILVNYMTTPKFLWGLIVCMGLVYGNIALHLSITGKTGYVFQSVSLVILAVFVLVGIDYLTGYRGWSVNFGLPAGILIMDVGIVVLIFVNRRNWQSYIMEEILTIVLSVIPIVLSFLGVVTFPYVAYAAAGVSVFVFLGTVMIGDQRAKTELKRRFHI